MEHLLYSLGDDFKWIGSSMHVNKAKALISLNIRISCKTNHTPQKTSRFGSFELDFCSFFLSQIL